MSRVIELYDKLTALQDDADTMPVVVQSTITGTVYELTDSIEVTTITEEHRFLGCKLPVGTQVVFLKTK